MMPPNESRADAAQYESDRLSTFLACRPIGESAGPITLDPGSFGSQEDWAWSAVSYLKCVLNGTQGGVLGGSVNVSAAAIGILLTYVERLAVGAGVIGGDA